MSWSEAFGATLREVREQRGASQVSMAQAIGLDRSYVSGLERGLHSPSLDTMAKLCEFLKLDLSRFIARVSRRRMLKAA